MNGDYKGSVDVPCLELLFTSSRRHRQELVRFLDSLARDPISVAILRNAEFLAHLPSEIPSSIYGDVLGRSRRQRSSGCCNSEILTAQIQLI